MALVIDLPLHSARMSDSVVGYSMPPATPTSICAAMSMAGVCENADMIENGTDRMAPRMSSFLRP